ncbi:hypothetical protein M2150_001698 [Lachnospiraceae bacterium PM6-15]|uniref:DpnD/PcfM family protein n=1 Tax=Ohessyouella blattaphilus TaxID=2949333 RepID=UPI003E2071D7
MTKGNVCEFDFYVIGLLDMPEGETLHEMGLDLHEAMKTFEEGIGKYPNSVVALGVNYIANKELGLKYRQGGADLVQFLRGKMHFSEDCLKSKVLSQEGLICVNALNILKQTFEGEERKKGMDTYKVTITETLEKEVELEAGSREEALLIVKEGYSKGEHVLDYNNLTGTEFDISQSPVPTWYFTFGSSRQYPYDSGWVEVRAETRQEAIDLYKEKYPNVSHNIYNCADIYSEKQMHETEMYVSGNRGAKCHDVIDKSQHNEPQYYVVHFEEKGITLAEYGLSAEEYLEYSKYKNPIPLGGGDYRVDTLGSYAPSVTVEDRNKPKKPKSRGAR